MKSTVGERKHILIPLMSMALVFEQWADENVSMFDAMEGEVPARAEMWRLKSKQAVDALRECVTPEEYRQIVESLERQYELEMMP